jgi:DNA-binding response OmpR family regulator
MIALSRDAAWLARLEHLARRGGWPFESRSAVPSGKAKPAESAVVVLDREVAGAALPRAVAVLRGLYPPAAIALAFDEDDVATVSAAVACGADEVLGKSWPDEKLARRLMALRDRALAAQARYSADGELKAELRSHRAFVKARGRWKEAVLDAGAFALLWRLLEGGAISRDELGNALARAAGREREAGTIARRLAALRKSLSPWKGRIETMRGGFYRLSR